jgi:ribosome maturation factor RimP
MPPTFFCSSRNLGHCVNDELERVVSTELDAIGFDLVELRKGGSKSRPLLDVRIDRRDGEAVTVDDCARASRAIEARLDLGDLVGERYVLEVSSPGVERPLRTAAEWRRFVGKQANVNSELLGGRQEIEIVAVEGDGGGDVVVARTKKGQEVRLPLAEVKEARLAFHFGGR